MAKGDPNSQEIFAGEEESSSQAPALNLAGSGMLSGAAFLMAVSSIGPGFLTQTTQFTAQLGASFAFAILISIIIDIGAQLNTWRVICVSGKRGHEIADMVTPGLGWLLTAVIVFGSFIFNVGNISGCALGLRVLFGTDLYFGASISALLAIGLFLLPRAGSAMDWFSKMLGALMILLTLYIAFKTRPPVGEVIGQSLSPDEPLKNLITPIITIIGGTVGGYVMFSGAHRLLDGGVIGESNIKAISKASVMGILVTGVMRTVLFLAALGVVTSVGSGAIGKETPVFDAFRAGAGSFGHRVSGLVFWSAAITSVVGCSYTSISFLFRSQQGSASNRNRQLLTVAFIGLTLIVFLAIRVPPTPLLVAAGTLNGALLPVALGVILIASTRSKIVGQYRHPWWAKLFGMAAWLVAVFMAYRAVAEGIPKLLE